MAKLSRLTLITFLLSLTGCGQFLTNAPIERAINGSQNPKDPGPVLPPPGEGGSTVINGKALYAESCARCHGDLLESSKRNTTLEALKLAIKEQTSMKASEALKGLSDAELSAIIAALSDAPTTPTPTPGGGDPGFELEDNDRFSAVDAQPLIGTRLFVASAFRDVFGEPPGTTRNSDDEYIHTRITSLVANQASTFGGNCTLNDSSCPRTAVNAEMLPRANSLRKGYTARACREILSRNRSIHNALGKVELNNNSPRNAANIESVFDLFSPGYAMAPQTLTRLMALAKASSDAGHNALEQWRVLLLPMCESVMFDLM